MEQIERNSDEQFGELMRLAERHGLRGLEAAQWAEDQLKPKPRATEPTLPLFQE